MRCDNCVFWHKPSDQFDETWRGDFGMCDKTPHAEDVGKWDDDMHWSLADEYADRTSVVQDASGYSATLYTKPSHFCAMYKVAK